MSLDDLTLMANEVGSDKGTKSEGHHYSRIYMKHFSDMRHRKIILLEMGLLRVDADGRRNGNATEGSSTLIANRSPSLEMWRRFFPNAILFGLDIDDFSAVRIPDCHIFQGDMSSGADLEKIGAAIGQPIDIIIDDASHASHHQQIALGTLFPFVREGGKYVIEDLHWQDQSLERAGVLKTRDLMRQFLSSRKLRSEFISEDQIAYIEEHVADVSLYDSLSRQSDDPTDALAIITKIDLRREG